MALQSPTDQAELLTRVLAEAIYGSDHSPIDRFLMGNTPSFNCDGAQYAALQAGAQKLLTTYPEEAEALISKAKAA